MLLYQPLGTLPLEPLHLVARREVRRAGDDQVDLVGADFPLSNLLWDFVIHTRWSLMSKWVWAVRRYCSIPGAYGKWSPEGEGF